jgi:hypothetical protein
MFKRTIASLLVVVSALWASDASAQARNARLAKADQAVSDGVRAGGRIRVIVRTRERSTATVKRRAEKAGALRRSHDKLGVFAAELEAGDVKALLKDPDVLGVSIDDVVRIQNRDEDPTHNHQGRARKGDNDRKGNGRTDRGRNDRDRDDNDRNHASPEHGHREPRQSRPRRTTPTVTARTSRA